jgi:hypothetical protein
MGGFVARLVPLLILGRMVPEMRQTRLVLVTVVIRCRNHGGHRF